MAGVSSVDKGNCNLVWRKRTGTRMEPNGTENWLVNEMNGSTGSTGFWESWVWHGAGAGTASI